MYSSNLVVVHIYNIFCLCATITYSRKILQGDPNGISKPPVYCDHLFGPDIHKISIWTLKHNDHITELL